MGHNYELQQNTERAEQFYAEALSAVDARPNYAYSIARTFQKYSLLKYAAETYEKAMQLNNELNFNMQLARIYGEQGKTAITHYSVVERLGYVNLVECRLETGRTHQIRVHFQYLGHPLFNDPEYGGDRILRGTTFTKYRQFVENCFKALPGQALHARTLGFEHPGSGKNMLFEAPLPEGFSHVLEKWRSYIQGRHDA